MKKVDTTLADAVKTRHAQNEATRSAIETLAGKMSVPIPPTTSTITDDNAGTTAPDDKKPKEMKKGT